MGSLKGWALFYFYIIPLHAVLYKWRWFFFDAYISGSFPGITHLSVSVNLDRSITIETKANPLLG